MRVTAQLIHCLFCFLGFLISTRGIASPIDGPYYFNEWVVHAQVDGQTYTGDAIPYLKSAGFTDEDLKAWTPFVLSAYCFSKFSHSGPCFSDSDDSLWIEGAELKEWKNSGLGPDDAALYYKLRLTVDQALKVSPTVKSKCDGKIGADITVINPYVTKGKCYFLYDFCVFQLMDAKTALVTNNIQQVLVTYDHGYSPAEGQRVMLLVKSKGAWIYETAIGAKSTVPNVSVISDLNQGE